MSLPDWTQRNDQQAWCWVLPPLLMSSSYSDGFWILKRLWGTKAEGQRSSPGHVQTCLIWLLHNEAAETSTCLVWKAKWAVGVPRLCRWHTDRNGLTFNTHSHTYNAFCGPNSLCLLLKDWLGEKSVLCWLSKVLTKGQQQLKSDKLLFLCLLYQHSTKKRLLKGCD